MSRHFDHWYHQKATQRVRRRQVRVQAEALEVATKKDEVPKPLPSTYLDIGFVYGIAIGQLITIVVALVVYRIMTL